MKDQLGHLEEETTGRGENFQSCRYLPKYVIKAARTFGIDAYVGSLEDGKLANIVLWRPEVFGIKSELVIKGGQSCLADDMRAGPGAPAMGCVR